jgi:tetratricopeptide (TPR) repeat protein
MDPTADELIARLRRNPDDGAAYAALRAHYQRIGDYASLVNLLEGFAGRSRDHAAAGQSFFDAAELAWGALGDAARGASLYERALERHPAHDDAFARLLAIYEQAGDAQRLATIYERRAEGLSAAGGDPRAIAQIHQRLGELWEHTFHRADRAIVHYRKAFELDATLVPAIYAAREIYRQAGNQKAVAALLELEAKAEPEDERKVALLRELAHLRAETLGDPEGAVVALKRALTHAPANNELLEDLATLYLQRAERQPDAQIAESDRRRATDVLFQLAQKLPPTEAVPLLERALDTTPDHDGALTLLERIAERVGHIELLPARWVAFLARAPESPLAKQRRKRLARAYLDAGQVDYAIACLEWVAEEGDAETIEQLVDLYRRIGREQDATALLSRAGSALPVPMRVGHLRASMEGALQRGDEDTAAQLARDILAADAADPEATAFLEDRHRRRGEWNELRALLYAAGRVPGLSVDARKQRFREVAQICERRLNDADGAVQAWKQVVTLDVADREARGALARLLEQLEKWDDLAQAVERDAVAATDDAAKLEAYKRLARIHGEKRNDQAEAALAWRAALDVSPHDAEARDGWITGLLAANALPQAIAPMRERARLAPIGPERAEAHRSLARTLDRLAHQRADEDPSAPLDARWGEAVEAWTRVLDDATNDTEALDRLEVLDRRIGDWERLMRTLSYRADLEQGRGRIEVLVRMGEVAEHSLGDLARAAEVYHRAFDLDPKDERVIDALTSVYERTERYRDIVTLLNERAHVEDEPARRAALYRRIARVLAERVQNDDGAAEAYQKVLEAGEDREALLFLEQRAEHRGDFEEAERLLVRIADVAESGVERRDRLTRRADLLADALGRRDAAIEVLSHVVRELDPTHLPSLGRLGDLAEEAGDTQLLADTLERTLAVVDDPTLRAPIAERLGKLYLHELADAPRAIAALTQWHEASPFEEEPLRLLLPVLESQGRVRELVTALDALAELEGDPAQVSALVRRAAALSFQHLQDFEGARTRLESRVRDGDEDAQNDYLAFAAQAGAGDAIVSFFSDLAGEADDPLVQKRRWLDAASAAERIGADVARALELVLKALALDLSDTRVLDEADRLALASRQFPRLQQVYDTLLRKAEAKERKVELLVRQADILRRDPNEQVNAFERLLRAASLAPFDARVLLSLEELGPRLGRAEELLVVYDRRKKDAPNDEARVAELVSSARIAEMHLGDRERAVTYLALAVALAVRSPGLFETVEARALEVGAELERALVDVYGALAEDMEADPRGAAAILVRASSLLRKPPRDDEGAYGALLRAVTLAPFDETALDALEALAAERRKLSALSQQLGKLVEEALDGKTASILLRRRARVLEREGKADQAAECWVRLRQLSPSDADVRVQLRATLRRARKFDDLLMALENDLRALKEPATQLALRREVAQTWERNLKNRWEALEAWERVKKLAPEDAEGLDAIARLKQGGSGILRSDDGDDAPPVEVSAEAPDDVLDADDALLDADAAVDEAPVADALGAATELASDDLATAPPSGGELSAAELPSAEPTGELVDEDADSIVDGVPDDDLASVPDAGAPSSLLAASDDSHEASPSAPPQSDDEDDRAGETLAVEPVDEDLADVPEAADLADVSDVADVDEVSDIEEADLAEADVADADVDAEEVSDAAEVEDVGEAIELGARKPADDVDEIDRAIAEADAADRRRASAAPLVPPLPGVGSALREATGELDEDDLEPRGETGELDIGDLEPVAKAGTLQIVDSDEPVSLSSLDSLVKSSSDDVDEIDEELEADDAEDVEPMPAIQSSRPPPPPPRGGASVPPKPPPPPPRKT